MRSTPPAAGLKLERCVSTRPDVHCPELLRTGVIRKLPEPSGEVVRPDLRPPRGRRGEGGLDGDGGRGDEDCGDEHGSHEDS
ncbi:hypothetical protein Ahu01nite_058760 [Winogradskya humida]|uniref:Uncharacterized protein n=1 Tax=Winogradskya humida TaxID=113566 RepID=A0ABQ3ZW17_9ACTN|nr:hypothetical protein Ahu01nite_058760 [Actinoplanes humidus]